MVFTSLWVLYYVYSNNLTTPNIAASDRKIHKSSSTSERGNTLGFIAGLVALVLLNYVFVHNINIHHAYANNIYISNNTMVYFFLSLLSLVLIVSGGFFLIRQNLSFRTEYLLFVTAAVISGFFLMSSSNVYMSIFLLELVSLLIFGKFAVTRVVTNANAIDLKNKFSSFLKQFSYGLFNSLFFQFWANFVSSVFLFFAVINVHYLFGTSNFFMLNFFLEVLAATFYVPNVIGVFTVIMLTTGLFIKLGLSPYQFFKIETYKGIPLFSVIVYTTIYLVIYVYFFAYLYIYQVPKIRQFINPYAMVVLLISVSYLLSLLFDTKNFKAFLSYSTLVTVVNLLVVVLMI